VLDLMSSWTSHLPDDLKVKRLVGVGMNEEELRANPLLTERRVLDLNQEQVTRLCPGGLIFSSSLTDCLIRWSCPSTTTRLMWFSVR
jgi:hypothetical protein